jgi:hypothetical protein
MKWRRDDYCRAGLRRLRPSPSDEPQDPWVLDDFVNRDETERTLIVCKAWAKPVSCPWSKFAMCETAAHTAASDEEWCVISN